jgi:hypothetical protein
MIKVMLIIIILLLACICLFWYFEQKRRLRNMSHRKERREDLNELLNTIRNNEATPANTIKKNEE